MTHFIWRNCIRSLGIYLLNAIHGCGEVVVACGSRRYISGQSAEPDTQARPQTQLQPP